MSALTFDPDLHEYREAGRVVPSVTQILDQLTDFSMVKPEHLERARVLGTAVHRMVELDCMGMLDESTVQGPLVGFLGQWRDFVKVTNFRLKATELRLYSARYGYAGTMDLLGQIDGRDVLIDTKSGATPKTAGLQTAAYLNLGIENGLMTPATERRVLDLKENDWRLTKPYPNYAGDLRVFLSALTLQNWKKEHAV